MPINTATNSPVNNTNSSTPAQKFSLGKLSKRKRNLLIFVGLFVIAAVLAFLTTKNQINFSNPFNKSPESISVVDKETRTLTDDAYKNIKDITIEQVKEASVSTGINPLEDAALSDASKVDEINKQIGNDNPQNNVITYSNPEGLSLPYVEINQGDLVTWINDSSAPMVVVGDGWQTNVPRDPGDQYSYGFLYLGEYKYKINETEGIVNVVSKK